MLTACTNYSCNSKEFNYTVDDRYNSAKIFMFIVGVRPQCDTLRAHI